MMILMTMILMKPINQNDFSFLLSQEEWVASQAIVLTVDRPDLILNLGGKKYRWREEASTALRIMGQKAWPYLIWGTYSRDSEISQRSYNILKQYFRCEVCAGSGNILGVERRGESPDAEAMGEENMPTDFTCESCKGNGYFYEINKPLDGKTGWMHH